ncbi:hypothetical protein AVEN_78534-1 [Araneus ventricosus]|uniref:Uncharacterized protein n=1 Tax=Araneus ventricosus TaxID=182803 RepID=A0A4Y2EQJ1_ARAVE|nr:hypothetical protein AVEN_78534-1 [Araneus ventricosus]
MRKGSGNVMPQNFQSDKRDIIDSEDQLPPTVPCTPRKTEILDNIIDSEDNLPSTVLCTPRKTETRERRENLKKSRRERSLLNEEKRIKKIEKDEEILKRKIIDVKDKAKRRKLSKVFTKSSEVYPGVKREPQSSQTGIDGTYLFENLKDVSIIEPTEHRQDYSNGRGLNYALLYSSAYDKKIFMQQSVVLSNIAQLMPAGIIQNSINLSQNKEIKRICNRKPNYFPDNLRKIKLSVISKKNSTRGSSKYTGSL